MERSLVFYKVDQEKVTLIKIMKKGKSGGNLIKGRYQGGKRTSILIIILLFEILESSPRQGFRVSVEALASLLVSVLQRYTLTSSTARSFRSSIGTLFAEIGIYQ